MEARLETLRGHWGSLLRDPGAGGRADCMVRNSGEEGLVITVATVAGLQLLVWHLPPWFIFWFLIHFPFS